MNRLKVFLESSVDSIKRGEFICIGGRSFHNWAEKWVSNNVNHTIRFLQLGYIPEIKFSRGSKLNVYSDDFDINAPLSIGNRLQLLDLSKYDIRRLGDENGYRVALIINTDRIISSSYYMSGIGKARFIHSFIRELSEYDQFCRDRDDFSSILNMGDYTPNAIKDLEKYNVELHNRRARLDADKYLRYIGVKDSLIEYIQNKYQ